LRFEFKARAGNRPRFSICGNPDFTSAANVNLLRLSPNPDSI
jgi:hypothetical protein